MRPGCRIFAVRVSDFLRSGVSDKDEIFRYNNNGLFCFLIISFKALFEKESTPG